MKYVITEIKTIAAPEGIPKLYETPSPAKQKIPLKTEAAIILPLRFFEINAAHAAGAVSKAITKIIPTTRINATTLRAVKISTIYSKKAVLIPATFEKPLSNKKALRSL